MGAIIKWADIWGKPKTFPSIGATDPMGLGFAIGVDPATAGNTVTIGAAGRTVFMRLRNGGTASKVGIYVGTASGNIAVAAYSNSGAGRSAVPGTRLAASGSVACPAAGYAEVALGASVSLNPGDWLALACDNNTATFGAAAGLNSNLLAGLICNQDSSAFPCPATPAIAGYGSRMLSLVGVP